MDFEAVIRLSLFFSVLGLLLVVERVVPLRDVHTLVRYRSVSNIAFTLVNSLCLRIVFPITAVGLAVWVEQRNLGLFPWLGLPKWLTLVLTVVVMDWVIWGQHWLFHKYPLLWRLHRMHHSDLAFDVTTSLRFHPLEIVLSMAIKMVVVVLLGAPPVGVLVFEVLLNGVAMFNHSNIQLPQRWDSILRWVMVTPDMHRVHHSSIMKETNSNYGFNLSCWDRLFKTYRAQPEQGHLQMEIGLKEFREAKQQSFWQLLLQPFKDSR